MIALISVDQAKCLSPLECKKCMEICPSSVFVCGPTKIWKFRETDVSEYRLFARFIDVCSGCNECIKVCPSGALTLQLCTQEEFKQKVKSDEVGVDSLII